MSRPVIRAAVAGWDAGALGRVMVRLDESQVTLWAPAFSDGMDAEDQVEVARTLALWAVGVAEETGRDLVETKPADDTVHLDVWLRALELAGFVLISCGRLWEGAISGWRSVELDRGELQTRLIAELDPTDTDLLRALVGAARRSSLDRSLASDADGQQALMRLRDSTVAKPDSELWLTFLREGRPVAYVIGSVEKAGTLWVMDVGVDRAGRGAGLGLYAVGSLFKRAESRGITSCRALIDVENVPSEGIHRRLGLRPVADRFFTFHRVTPLVPG